MSTTLTTPTGTYARLAALPLRIDAYELSGLQLPLSERFTRLSTIVHLHGAGEEGQGEDPTYAPPDQLAFRAAGPVLPLAGEWTLDSFSAHLARLELFPFAPASADFLNFRRWAFESAALDLALRQAGLSLAATLGRPSRPVSFVVSPGPETSAEPVQARRLGRRQGACGQHQKSSPPVRRLPLCANMGHWSAVSPAWEGEEGVGERVAGTVST